MSRLLAAVTLGALLAGAAVQAAELPLVSEPATALAGGVGASTSATFPSPMVGPLIRICVAVAILCGLAMGLSWWARRRGVRAGVTDTRIRVLASRSLTGKHQLSLVEVSGHRLLIGTGNDSITTLADLTAADFQRELTEELPSGEPGSGSDGLVETIGRFEGLDA